jgi:hypothetical protein
MPPSVISFMETLGGTLCWLTGPDGLGRRHVDLQPRIPSSLTPILRFTGTPMTPWVGVGVSQRIGRSPVLRAGKGGPWLAQAKPKLT